MPNLRNAAVYACLVAGVGSVVVRLLKRPPTWHRYEPSFTESGPRSTDRPDLLELRYLMTALSMGPVELNQKPKATRELIDKISLSGDEWSKAKALRPDGEYDRASALYTVCAKHTPATHSLYPAPFVPARPDSSHFVQAGRQLSTHIMRPRRTRFRQFPDSVRSRLSGTGWSGVKRG